MTNKKTKTKTLRAIYSDYVTQLPILDILWKSNHDIEDFESQSESDLDSTRNSCDVKKKKNNIQSIPIVKIDKVLKKCSKRH